MLLLYLNAIFKNMCFLADVTIQTENGMVSLCVKRLLVSNFWLLGKHKIVILGQRLFQSCYASVARLSAGFKTWHYLSNIRSTS